MEIWLATHPLLTHLFVLVAGGPLLGITVNALAALISEKASPLRRAAATWLTATPGLAQAAFAVETPGLTLEEHDRRVKNLMDAVAVSVKRAIEAAQAPQPPRAA